jgi:uncharacterized protein YbdZ (MbtH family)
MITRLGGAALSLMVCMTASARSVSFDDWTHYVGAYSGTTATITPATLPYGILPSAVTSLELDPGAGAAGYQVVTNANLPKKYFAPGDAYTWFGTDAPGTDPDDQQFRVLTNTRKDFSLVFNDDSLSCAGQTASFTLNGTTYKSSSPCTAGMLVGTTDPTCLTCTGYNTSAFEFDVKNGKLQLDGALPTGWSVAAAPELDARSGASGSLLVLLGRRRLAPSKTQG